MRRRAKNLAAVGVLIAIGTIVGVGLSIGGAVFVSAEGDSATPPQADSVVIPEGLPLAAGSENDSSSILGAVPEEGAEVELTPDERAIPGCAGPKPAVIAAYVVVPGKNLPGAVDEPLVATVPNLEHGAEIYVDPEGGNCIACHAVKRLADRIIGNDSATEQKWGFQGNVGPALDGVARRYTIGELRFILLDPATAFADPDTVKSAYHTLKDLNNVAEICRGRPILSAYAIEDLVAYLGTLTP